MVRIAFEIGLEVLLALATAEIATAARRGAQTGKLAATTAKITSQAKRIGPFTKHAIDLMVDLAKALNKPVKVEEIKPVAKLQLPDYGKLNEPELRGGGDKVRTTASESNPNTAAMDGSYSALTGKYSKRTNAYYLATDDVNATFPDDWLPPYRPETRVNEFETTVDDIYVRVHGESNKARS